MIKNLVYIITIIIALSSTTPSQAENVIYRFGVVPQFEPRKLHEIWRPILTELETRTGLTFKMVRADDIPSFEETFMREEFDFAYMNPYHGMLAYRDWNYTAVVRDGVKKLYGILVVKKGGPIQEMSDLQGQTIAFPAPNALGAALLMRRDLTKDFNLDYIPKYTSTHQSVFLNVVLSQALAGGAVMATFERQEKDIQDQLTILYKTRKVPPHPVSAHKRVPAEHVELVRKAFLGMANTKSGAALLAKIPMNKVTRAVSSEYDMLDKLGLDEFWVKRE